MAEILLRVVDKTNPDPVLDAMCTKKGDVISVQADGWPWGHDELANPDWRIIKMPSLSVSLILDLIEPEMDLDNTGNRVTIRKRAKYLNFESLPTNVKNKILNATAPITFNVTEAQALRALTVTKPSAKVVAG